MFLDYASQNTTTTCVRPKIASGKKRYPAFIDFCVDKAGVDDSFVAHIIKERCRLNGVSHVDFKIVACRCAEFKNSLCRCVEFRYLGP